MTAPAIERFNGLVHWAKLTTDQQREIGSLALELMAAWYGAEQAAMRADPAARDLANLTAQQRVGELLQAAFVVAIPRDDLHGEEGRIRVPVSIGPVCRGCGCSEQDACPGGCAWVDDDADLCTACQARGIA